MNVYLLKYIPYLNMNGYKNENHNNNINNFNYYNKTTSIVL